MRKIIWAVVIGLACGIWTKQSEAHDGPGNPRDAARRSHAAYHDDLQHRAYHRALDHREAHRYPMTGYQHSQLHHQLRHEAYHDRLEHAAVHRSGAFDPRAYAGASSIWRGGCTAPIPASRYPVPYTAGYGNRGGITLQFGW